MEPKTLHKWTLFHIRNFTNYFSIPYSYSSDSTANSNFHEFSGIFNTFVCLLLFHSSKTIRLVKKNYGNSGFVVSKSLCFLRRPQKMTKSSPSIWHLLHNVKLMVNILSFFVAFLESLNFISTTWDI